MPFNSNFNSIKDNANNEESFHALQNNYNVAHDGYTYLSQPEFAYKPSNTINKEFIKPGRSGQSPQLNLEEQQKMDNLKQEVLAGEGVGRFFKKAGRTLKDSAVNKNGLIHKAIKTVNDQAIPMLGEALGTAVGTAMGNPELGAMAGNQLGEMARAKLNEETGYGTKGIGAYKKIVNKVAKDVKNVNLEKVLNKYAPEQVADVKKVIKDVKLGDVHLEGGNLKNKGGKSRNDIVKQVMKDKKMNLPQASKYVKENKLY